METIADCADDCEFKFLMVCIIFSGGARVHWLILFNSFLAKQLNIVCSINTKLFTYCALAHRFVQPKLAYIPYVSDSANFVAAKNQRTALFLLRQNLRKNKAAL